MKNTQFEKDTVLRSVSDLTGNRIEAVDGEIGKCRDLLFDDEKWTIRYLVADTGGWLSNKKVIISPYSLAEPHLGADSDKISVMLTKQQVEDSPPLESHQPISRQHEKVLAEYYGYPFYWGGAGYWGGYAQPVRYAPLAPREQEQIRETEKEIEASHLRSYNEVRNYRIKASDGEIGHVEDFIAECDSWALRYLVVDTKNWLPGRKVLVSPSWIGNVDWHSSEMEVHLSREAIKNSPEYDPEKLVNRDYEEDLYKYYGQAYYWN